MPKSKKKHPFDIYGKPTQTLDSRTSIQWKKTCENLMYIHTVLQGFCHLLHYYWREERQSKLYSNVFFMKLALQLDCPNVSCRINMTRHNTCVVSYQNDTTRHMCLVKDTTQHHKTQKLFSVLNQNFVSSYIRFCFILCIWDFVSSLSVWDFVSS